MGRDRGARRQDGNAAFSVEREAHQEGARNGSAAGHGVPAVEFREWRAGRILLGDEGCEAAAVWRALYPADDGRDVVGRDGAREAVRRWACWMCGALLAETEVARWVRVSGLCKYRAWYESRGIMVP